MLGKVASQGTTAQHRPAVVEGVGDQVHCGGAQEGTSTWFPDDSVTKASVAFPCLLFHISFKALATALQRALRR